MLNEFQLFPILAASCKPGLTKGRDISLDSQTKVLVVRGEGGSVFKKREEGRWILNCRSGAWDACQPAMKEMVPNNREQPRRNVNVSRIFMLLRNLFIIIQAEGRQAREW